MLKSWISSVVLAIGMVALAESNDLGYITTQTPQGEMLCLTTATGALAGAQVSIDYCNNAPEQLWQPPASGQGRMVLNQQNQLFCLDVDTASYQPTAVNVWNCAGSVDTNQIWSWTGNGAIALVSKNQCIGLQAPGSQAHIGPCAAQPVWQLQSQVNISAVWVSGLINELYVDPSDVVVVLQTTQGPCAGKFLNLPRGNTNFRELFDLLLAAKLNNLPVTLWTQCNAPRGTISHGRVG